MSAPISEQSTTSRRRLARFAPLVAFALLAVLFFIRLYAGDASRIPSALIGKQAPAFSLPPLPGVESKSFSSDDLRKGHVTIVNVFASWCGPCHVEHEVLVALAQDPSLREKGVILAGLSYKDEPGKAKKFLDEGGNPYERIGVDASGRVAIDFGVYGVPETFVIRGDGAIAYKFVGPLTRQSLQTTLIPEIEKALR
jgi:cytochrome c biogenesis protein CcmG/thiol:disulfide interchange protein DsbE